MPHRDQGRSAEINASALERCLKTLLAQADFSQVLFRSNCSWTALSVVSALLFWVWSEARTLVDRWKDARRLVGIIFDQVELPKAYQPFIRLLRRHSDLLRDCVVMHFRGLMQERLGSCFRVGNFIAFAVDGSRVETPRTVSNEKAFAAKAKKGRPKKNQTKAERQKKRKKEQTKARLEKKEQTKADRLKASTPQIWLTMLWHLGSGLPWAWRRGESGSSERGHLREMLVELPAKSLLVADAGFTGYELWQAILANGHNILVRVGANVSLLTNLGLQREGSNRVWLWPDKHMSEGQPIPLRLVKRTQGRETVWLVTTILDRQQLSDALVGKIYRRRWGIEIYYRHLKQTFERRKLRSHRAENAVLELDWALVGLWAVNLLALLEDPKPDPPNVSMAGLLRAVRWAMRDALGKPEPGQDLFSRIRRARLDEYPRKQKASRDYPRQKRKERIGDPKIVPATESQRQLAKEYVMAEKALAI